ncbi:hypothetical protein PAEPH01_1972 [Pancytospora epiphaga]|nr:hypothetical protein PAEPH01_1972 [Pancytospora epiphaga]
MLIQKMLVSTASRFNLPIGVRSTSVLLYFRLKGAILCDKIILAYLCLLMSCKFEDVHARLDRLLIHAGCDKSHFKEILKLETDAMEHLNFDFVFPNIYTKAQALRYVLEGDNIELESTWEEDCERIDSLLCMEDFVRLVETYKERKDEFYNSIAYAVVRGKIENVDIIKRTSIPIDADIIKDVYGVIERLGVHGSK